MTLELPGAIVETNGTKAESGTSVSWKLVTKDLFRKGAGDFSVTFQGEGLALEAFEYTQPAEKPKGGGMGEEEED